VSSIQTIVVPHDFSEHADIALGMAAELAVELDADLHLLHVLQPRSYGYGSELYVGGPLHYGLSDQRDLRRASEFQLRALSETIPRFVRPISCHVVEGARVAEAIDLEAVVLGADLIVMGTHGRTGLAHLLLGSVAEATLRRAPCPVLTVPMRTVKIQEPDGLRAIRIPITGTA